MFSCLSTPGRRLHEFGVLRRLYLDLYRTRLESLKGLPHDIMASSSSMATTHHLNHVSSTPRVSLDSNSVAEPLRTVEVGLKILPCVISRPLKINVCLNSNVNRQNL